VNFDPSCKGAQAYVQLADEVLKRVGRERDEAARR